MTELQKLGQAAKCVISGQYHMTVMKIDNLIAKLPFTNTDLWKTKSVYHLVRLCQTTYVIALITEDKKHIVEAGEYLNQAMVIWHKIVF